MDPRLRIRLSLMMFVQFFIWGAWYVTVPAHLQRIGFGPEDLGWTYSTGPVAAMVTPLLVGMVADRFFAVERALGVLHLLGAAAMAGAAALMQRGAAPAAINWMLFAHMLCYFPTLALTNALAMRNIDDAQRQFPSLRVLGTIGWIVAGWTIQGLGWGSSVRMFHLAAAGAVVLGLYSFTLPHTPPAARGKPVDVKALLGFDALVLLRRRSFAVFMFCSFLVCIPLAFYYQLAAKAVQAGGIGDVARSMTYGQISEIGFMLLIPVCFARLGVKWMLVVAMLAWVARYVLFAIGVPAEITWMLLLGIILHGICYDFFFVTGQIYTDQVAPREIRSQAQGLLVLCTLGLGMFVGAQAGGRIEAHYTSAEAASFRERSTEIQRRIMDAEEQGTASGAEHEALEAEANRLQLEYLRRVDWGAIWATPAAGAAVVLLLFALLFRANGGRIR